MIYEDNAAAIMMANNSRPNGQARHIDISYFALQEWITYGNVKLAHIHRIANPADEWKFDMKWQNKQSSNQIRNGKQHK
eukprot:6134498-Ditylum_brightwellii.AAC.1